MNLSEKGWFKQLISSQAGIAESEIDNKSEYQANHSKTKVGLSTERKN